MKVRSCGLSLPHDVLDRAFAVDVYHGAQVRCRLGDGITDRHRVDPGGEPVHELVVDALLHEEPVGGDA